MKLSVVIPVYNEAKTIEEVIARVRRVSFPLEIIIVDDCSRDGTKEKLKALEKQYPEINVVYSDPNRGKGFAIRYGFQFVTGDVVIIQDADLEYNPQDYLRILEVYKDRHASVVYGSRFKGTCENMSFLQLFANKLFTFLTNLLHDVRLTDTCTCYKSFRADIIKSLPLSSEGFEICHEINAKLLRRNIPITEVPIVYRARTRKQGKKVDWKVFFTSIYAICKFAFND
ncbi:MAG: glycosyltransferase family 2 protein [Candidatus Omnitrophica bacterium]|nr:glycosyltransferase family 2 protein [Candidatus Omnitrophota bacterium]